MFNICYTCFNDFYNILTFFENWIINGKESIFFSKKIGENFEAYITSIKKFGLFVSLKEINIEGLIHKRNLGKDSFFFDFNKNSLIGKKNKETFKVGDYIKVKLIDINILLGQLSFQRILWLFYSFLN